MSEEKRDSTQELLEEVEGGWASPSSARLPAVKAADGDGQPAEGEAAATEETPAPISTPTLDSLDAGWIDELFDEDEDDDDEDEDDDDEEPEPELPDERLDPVAYAAAKKAREEREEARRQRRKAKAEAKKARRKQRASAAQQGQKQKQKKRKSKPAKEKRGKLPEARKAAPRPAPIERTDDEPMGEVMDIEEAPRKPVPKAKLVAPEARADTPWKLGVIALLVFLAAAAAIAAITSR